MNNEILLKHNSEKVNQTFYFIGSFSNDNYCIYVFTFIFENILCFYIHIREYLSNVFSIKLSRFHKFIVDKYRMLLLSYCCMNMTVIDLFLVVLAGIALLAAEIYDKILQAGRSFFISHFRHPEFVSCANRLYKVIWNMLMYNAKYDYFLASFMILRLVDFIDGYCDAEGQASLTRYADCCLEHVENYPCFNLNAY